MGIAPCGFLFSSSSPTSCPFLVSPVSPPLYLPYLLPFVSLKSLSLAGLFLCVCVSLRLTSNSPLLFLHALTRTIHLPLYHCHHTATSLSSPFAPPRYSLVLSFSLSHFLFCCWRCTLSLVCPLCVSVRRALLETRWCAFPLSFSLLYPITLPPSRSCRCCSCALSLSLCCITVCGGYRARPHLCNSACKAVAHVVPNAHCIEGISTGEIEHPGTNAHTHTHTCLLSCVCRF